MYINCAGSILVKRSFDLHHSRRHLHHWVFIYARILEQLVKKSLSDVIVYIFVSLTYEVSQKVYKELVKA